MVGPGPPTLGRVGDGRHDETNRILIQEDK